MSVGRGADVPQNCHGTGTSAPRRPEHPGGTPDTTLTRAHVGHRVRGVDGLTRRGRRGGGSVKRVSTGAGAGGVRVVDREALLLDGVDEVDRGALDVRR